MIFVRQYIERGQGLAEFRYPFRVLAAASTFGTGVTRCLFLSTSVRR
jgi:hypothetical protein